jgi:hypothetical protein
MKKRIIATVLCSLCLVSATAGAQALVENAPSSYTVVKGDTLWGISGKFLKDPWRWPEIWNLNKDQINDPHWIYPGDLIRLEITADGKPRLSVDTSPGSSLAGAVGADGTIKVVPRVRVDRLAQGIPSIPGAAISPFLGQPLVVEENGLADSPRIVAAEESRVVIGAGNSAYVDFVDPSQGTKWQIYRQGAALKDPDTGETLAYNAVFLGDARVTRFGSPGTPATIEVIKSVQEVNRGDRLTPTRESVIPSYAPRAPETKITGKIISVEGGVAEVGQYSVVIINRGKRDGLEIGHVLATYRAGEWVNTRDRGSSMNLGMGGLGSGISNLWNRLKPNPVVPDSQAAPAPSAAPTSATAEADRQRAAQASEMKLPDERNGLIFVFRVFDRVSYALIMQTRRPTYLYDVVQTP